MAPAFLTAKPKFLTKTSFVSAKLCIHEAILAGHQTNLSVIYSLFQFIRHADFIMIGFVIVKLTICISYCISGF